MVINNTCIYHVFFLSKQSTCHLLSLYFFNLCLSCFYRNFDASATSLFSIETNTVSKYFSGP